MLIISCIWWCKILKVTGEEEDAKEHTYESGPELSNDRYEERVVCIRHVTNITHLLQGKWTLQILCTMRMSPVRLSQLTRLIPKASKKGLRANLRALENAKVVERRDLSNKLLHVEYDFPEDMRESLVALVDHLEGWGRLLEADGQASKVFQKGERKSPSPTL